MTKEKKNGFKIELLFLIIVLAIGILTSFSYGSYLDEQIEKGILYSNVYEYARHLIPNAGITKDFAANEIVPISEAIDRDHGVALFYPISFIYEIEKTNIHLGSQIWHIYTFILVYLGMLCMYFAVKKLYDKPYIAIVSVLLFWFTPRMFAESHYNNKDMVLLAAFMAVMYFGLRVYSETKWPDVILFSLSGAIAMNIKIVGAWPFAVMGIAAFVKLVASKKFHQKILIKMIACIVLWALIFVLITPACFGGVINFFKYLIEFALDYSRWNDYVLYDGKMLFHNVTGTPHKYLLRMIVITTPLIHLALALAGIGGIIINLLSKKKEKIKPALMTLIFLLCGMVPLGFAVVSGTRVYNGWRHFYFVYPSLIMLMTFGFWFISESIKGKANMIPYIVISSYLLIIAAGIGINYPNECCYYNILAGKNIEERYELDYWDLSIYEAEKFILKNEEGTVSIGSLNAPTGWGIDRNYDRLSNSLKSRIEIVEPEDYTNAEYIIVNTTYAFMYSSDKYDEIKKDYILVKKIKSYGNTVCEVYKKQ